MSQNRDLQKGDRIRCKDPDDAVETAIQLAKEGYLWDFAYEHEGDKTKYFVVIEGTDDVINNKAQIYHV